MNIESRIAGGKAKLTASAQLAGVAGAIFAIFLAAPQIFARPAHAGTASGSPARATNTQAAPSASAPPVSKAPEVEVARGCVRSPGPLAGRVKASAFAPWLRGTEVPATSRAAPEACASCTMGLDSGPTCVWLDANDVTGAAGPVRAPGAVPLPAAAAPPAAITRQCPDLAVHDIFGAVDIAALLQGYLVQAPPSSYLPQLSRRAGLGELTTLCYGADLRSQKALSFEALLHVKPSPMGILATLGPPVAPQVPKEAGLAAIQTLSASVVPARVWNLLETLTAGMAPLQYTLLRVQLDTIEKAQQVRWADDILGTKPAVWSLVQDRSGDAVAVLEGVDGARAVTFLAAAVESLADLLPGLNINVFKKAVTMATLTVPAGNRSAPLVLHLAFSPRRLIVASSPAALTPYLKKRDGVGRAAALRATPATVFGTLDAAREAPFWRRLPGVTPPPLIKNARGAWFFSPDPQGWRVSVEMTVERQTFGQ